MAEEFGACNYFFFILVISIPLPFFLPIKRLKGHTWIRITLPLVDHNSIENTAGSFYGLGEFYPYRIFKSVNLTSSSFDSVQIKNQMIQVSSFHYTVWRWTCNHRLFFFLFFCFVFLMYDLFISFKNSITWYWTKRRIAARSQVQCVSMKVWNGLQRSKRTRLDIASEWNQTATSNSFLLKKPKYRNTQRSVIVGDWIK